MNIKIKALVLFSGGQDSATCLAWALSRFDHVETVGFDYEQRHMVEMQCRMDVLAHIKAEFPQWAPKMGKDHIIDIPALGGISETSLTRDIDIDDTGDGLPNTFVPGRNLIFLNFAAAVAYNRGITQLVAGMCEADFSGYPDCRKETLDAAMKAINLGMDADYSLSTPLMHLSKAGAWKLAEDLGGKALVDLIVQKSHTCYTGERGDLHAWGHGCGACPACELRANGWANYVTGTFNR
ncbi:MAG: 7-cyano-7-deazaguanine synthase QueC [Acidimicrobiales bacterium]|nr:7-cyano-7-deazaguanine synthase QueC [Hyphomonadaceae bacterium]RZV41913.1 MAG: 7-cyano-7-deazaguanine synthase QueC [Acidimicrobiales bacterium]